jgi:hypothetical protein
MKCFFLSLLLVCLLSACQTPTGEPGGKDMFSKLPSPSEPVPVQSPSVPKGAAPPWIGIAGDFRNPGRYNWTNGMTLKDGIDATGGLTENGSRRLRIQHWDDSIDHYRLRSGWEFTNNPALRAGDFIATWRDF